VPDDSEEDNDEGGGADDGDDDVTMTMDQEMTTKMMVEDKHLTIARFPRKRPW
jgi:hypothetical protein